MSERKAPYWESPLDIWKLLLTLAAVAALVWLRGGGDISADLPEAVLPSADLEDVDLPSGDLAVVDLPSFDLPDLGELFSSGDLPALSGRASAGSTVLLYDGETLLGEVQADEAGRWTFDLPEALQPGSHSLRALTLDAEGDQIEGETWTFEIGESMLVDEANVSGRGQAPIIESPGSEAAPGSTVEGNAEASARLMIYAGETLLGSTEADDQGRWSFDLPRDLSTEAILLRVVSVDESGAELSDFSRSIRILPSALPRTGRG